MGIRPIAVAGGRLDIRGVDYDSMSHDCPSWVNLQDVWEEPIPVDSTIYQYTSYIHVDGDDNGNADVTCLNGKTCTLEVDSSDPIESTTRTLQTTSSSTTCLRIITGNNDNDDGNLIVRVDTGDGNGYIEIESGTFHDIGSLVIEQCYPNIAGVQVTNSNNNAWGGKIETSSGDGGGAMYTPMICKENCTPQTQMTKLKVGVDAATCWSRGKKIVLTNTNPMIRKHYNQEVLSIAEVDLDAGVLTVMKDKASIGNPFTLVSEPMMAAEVASLSRPVLFTSVKTTSLNHGGHLMIYHTPHVVQKIEGVEFRSFGQSGILGRYPIHFHHSHDVAGSVIRKNLVQDSEQRCIVVHGTNSVMIDNNVAYDTRGHCFILEDGSETDNTFKDNLGVRTKLGKSESKKLLPLVIVLHISCLTGL